MKKSIKKWLTTTAVVSIAVVSVAAVAGPDGRGKERRAEARFNRIDTDGDGFISKAEQMAFAEARFDKTDANGDGQLTLKEIKMAHLKYRMEKLEKQPE